MVSIGVVCLDKRTCKKYKLVSIDLEKGVLHYLDNTKLVKNKIKNFIIYEDEKDYRKVE